MQRWGADDAHAPDAILTRKEVAAWLKVKPRQVEQLGVPCLDLAHKTKRYFAKDVFDWLEAKRTSRRCERLDPDMELTYCQVQS